MRVTNSNLQPPFDEEELADALRRIQRRCQEESQNPFVYERYRVHIVPFTMVVLAEEIPYKRFGIFPYTRRRLLLRASSPWIRILDGKKAMKVDVFESPFMEIVREELIALGENIGLDVLDLPEHPPKCW